MGGKQADRAKKVAKKQQDDEPETTVASGDLLGRVKALFMESCIVQNGPKVVDLLQDKEIAKPAEKKEEKKEEAKDDKENEEKTNEEKERDAKASEDKDAGAKESGVVTAKDMFESLGAQLSYFNILGFAEPASGEEALKAFIALKDLELDFGPRAKRRGNPGLDRIVVNVYNNLPQYLHIMLALMMLRAFLFRSFFACLPWLVGYQVLSLLIPLTNVPQVPQVPLEQVPTKFRVAGTLAIHALVWLFFLFEVVWKTYFFEKIPLIGIFAYHAYAVRPVDQ